MIGGGGGSGTPKECNVTPCRFETLMLSRKHNVYCVGPQLVSSESIRNIRDQQCLLGYLHAFIA